MATFQLQVVTMDGLIYDGEVESISLRSVHGDIAILAKHIDYCTAIGMGTATVRLPDGTEQKAACMGGMLSMMDNLCRVIPTTWEWSHEIDVERAENAKKAAQERLDDARLSNEARVRAEAKLRRALVRLSSAGK